MISIWITLIFLAQAAVSWAYMATVEVGVESFSIINPQIASEGTVCDTGGHMNRCDTVFYIQDCSSRFDGFSYACITKIDRHYGPRNTDAFQFDPLSRPAVNFIIDGFPHILVVNITIYDEDDGYSADDFIGSYIMRFSPQLISNLDRQPGIRQEVITIPGHSQLTLMYRAFCNDNDCRQRVFQDDGGTLAGLGGLGSPYAYQGVSSPYFYQNTLSYPYTYQQGYNPYLFYQGLTQQPLAYGDRYLYGTYRQWSPRRRRRRRRRR